MKFIFLKIALSQTRLANLVGLVLVQGQLLMRRLGWGSILKAGAQVVFKIEVPRLGLESLGLKVGLA